MDNYQSTNENNRLMNPDSSIELSPLRPFGKWYNNVFNEELNLNCLTHTAILAISKKDILKKPKSFYEKLITHLNTHKNPENGHYFERSWTKIFDLNEENYVF